jgi:ribosome-associated protein
MEEQAIVRGRKAGTRSQASSDGLLGLIEKTLDDHKAQDIVVIDLNGKSSIADYMVIASGSSQRQIGATADHLSQNIKDATGHTANVEGTQHCDWVLIDAGDVIVHLFRPEIRSFYNLEKMWGMNMPEPERVTAMA